MDLKHCLALTEEVFKTKIEAPSLLKFERHSKSRKIYNTDANRYSHARDCAIIMGNGDIHSPCRVRRHAQLQEVEEL